MEISNYLISAAISSSQSQLAQSVGVALIKKVMDGQESQAAALVEQLSSAAVAPPPSGHLIEITV
ncbi:putative motility protein [Bacillota bacterium Meth-B3]|nr:YjfB family protein [Christensenellaceae bacterium]MEA5066124.1 YjfB family protein [Eubacteriales bacterium]MEA5069921.1 YjfB family protein [Christensenellaceae bacterium]